MAGIRPPHRDSLVSGEYWFRTGFCGLNTRSISLDPSKSSTCPYRLLGPGQGIVQTAEVRDEFDPSTSLDLPREWAIFAQRQVRSGAVVVVAISSEHAAQMRFADNDQMVQAFSSDRSDQSLNVAVLPR